MWQEFRFAGRLLRKRPAFDALVTLTLALGIGSTAAVFSLVQGVLLTPPPYRDSDRVVIVPSVRVDSERAERLEPTPATQWLDWQEHATSFEAIAAYAWAFNFLVDQEGSASLSGMMVTPDYFRVIGVQPLLGRRFVDADSAPPSTVIILGYDCWQRRFNGDRAIVGKTIRISRYQSPPTVIGVMPPGLRFLPSPGASQEPNYNVNAYVDFWITARPNPQRLRESRWDVVGRLKPRVTAAQAQAELRRQIVDQPIERVAVARDGDRVHRRRLAFLPRLDVAHGARVSGFSLVGTLLTVVGVYGVLALSVAARRKEMAIRTALGAAQRDIHRLVVGEGFRLVIVGIAAGVAVSLLAARVLLSFLFDVAPTDPTTMVIAALLFSGVTLIACWIPSRRAATVDAVEALRCE
jgi:putative ABC transport system permease protein